MVNEAFKIILDDSGTKHSGAADGVIDMTRSDIKKSKPKHKTIIYKKKELVPES